MPQGIVLVVPIAAALVNTPEGVRCGPATQAACEQAMCIAIANPGAYILLPAGRAGKRYRNVVMALTMASYILDHPQRPGALQVSIAHARMFNTLGEIMAVAEYIAAMREGQRPSRVIFAVKEWHAWRVAFLARRTFRLFGLSDVTPEFETHEAPGRPLEKLLEFPKAIRHLGMLYAFHALYLLRRGWRESFP